MNKSIYFLVIGTLLGWLLEITFKTLSRQANVSAGMSQGPFCILYGIGTVVLAIFISKYTNNIFISFILSLICLTGLEYITGILLDKVYGIELWDYSHMKFGLNKYVSLEFAVSWGILGVIFVRYILPLLNKFYVYTYGPAQILIIYSIMFCIIIDYIYSSIRLLHIREIINV